MSERDLNQIKECASKYDRLKEASDFADNCIRFISSPEVRNGNYLEILAPCRYPKSVEAKTDELFMDEILLAFKQLKLRFDGEISQLSLEIGEKPAFLVIEPGESAD
jgi:hypothetical protein